MAVSRVTPRTLTLAALTVTAAVVLAVAIWPAGTADTTGSSPPGVRGGGVAETDPAVPPPLGLEQMDAERAVPGNRRDLFRFGSAQPAADPDDEGAPAGASRPAGGGRRGAPVPPPVEQPQLPPAPAPIPLRFVGLVQARDGVKVAALSDGRYTFYGREGDVIEGRWRIVTIGVESLVVERIDGTGRQTIRYAGGG